MQTFETEYKRLNKAQKESVDTIDGPVMVVAGPGTGKTQILALRIANILKKTDTHADGILCLTFTNSGVFAMRERLRKYIGGDASKIEISTFHSFAIKLIEEHYEILGFREIPSLIDDVLSISLCDEILSTNDFEHLRTRANKTLYFREIKSLISLLKRERLSPEAFEIEIQNEIKTIKENPDSISTRGESKGSLKQDVLRNIEGLLRTQEVVTFYQQYEHLKKSRALLDFDDVLEEMVRLVEISEDVRDTIREQYLYVLVDEHQDSSGVQNEFLAAVWGDTERPNLFVVGDDRQLIYGFGGADISYFEGFKKVFKGVSLITLTENYRSTQIILDVADALLQSSLTEAKLTSQEKENFPLRIIEAEYVRDEILRAGLEIKNRLEKGAKPEDFAILVPKNREVKSAVRTLSDLGLPVSRDGNSELFAEKDALLFIELLRIVASPEAPEYLARVLLSPLSGIPPIVAHQFLAHEDNYHLTLSSLLSRKDTLGLYLEEDSISVFSKRLGELISENSTDVFSLIQKAGSLFLIGTARNHEELLIRVEIIRTLLNLAQSQIEKNPNVTLLEFLAFLVRLHEYNASISLATLGNDAGIKVMTLHASKGLEFEYVYICHLDEKNLLGRRNKSFTLPESIKELEHQKDVEAIKRELYVALTRAKKECTLSYSNRSDTGAELEFSNVLIGLPGDFFARVSAQETEAFIKSFGIETYVTSQKKDIEPILKEGLAKLVMSEYGKQKLAVTHLNNFFECPWKWYFRNFLKLPEPKTTSLEFGNLVHGTLELLLKGMIKEKDVSNTISEKAKKIHGFSPEEISRMEKDAEKILKNFQENYLPKIKKERESEKALSFRDEAFSNFLITGKIDLVETLEPHVRRVTDFKTGSVKKKADIERESPEGRMSDYYRQLAMYTYLLNRTTKGDLEVSDSELLFLEGSQKDAVYHTHITKEHVESLLNDIKDFDQLLSSGKWIERECQFKPWKTGEVCEYCKLAQLYKK